MSIRKYLADAQRSAHEGFVNADGFFDDDLSFTAGEDFMSANGAAWKTNVPEEATNLMLTVGSFSPPDALTSFVNKANLSGWTYTRFE